MDEKTELLICLGAATAANCVPCFQYYFKKASAAGVEGAQVLKAVELATKVKAGSDIFMRKSVRGIMACNGEFDPQEAGAGGRPCCC